MSSIGDNICKFIVIIAILIFFGLIICNFVYSFLYLEYNYENNLIISEFENNINGYLIESISFRKSCNGDEEILVLGEWDGTIEGCDCDGIIFKEKCSSDQIQNSCISLFANTPENYTIFNSNYICAKKSMLSYKELLKSNQVVNEENDCPINYKSCGYLDTMKRKLCIKNDEICPINNITIQNQIPILINNNKENNDSNNNSNAQLITIVKLSQYKQCINPTEKFWDYHYPLEMTKKRCDTKLKGNIYDERYKIISNFSISKLQLYNENSITGKLKDIDEVCLNKISNDKIFLFTRNFIGFDLKELDNLQYNYEDLITYQKRSNTCFFINSIFNYVAFISGILSLLLELDIIEKINLYFTKCNLKKCSPIFESICILTASFSPFVYLILFSIIFDSNKKIKIILNIKGIDEVTSELLNMLIDEGSTNYIYSLTIVILSSFDVIFSPYFIRIFYCDNDDENNEIKKDFLNN